MKDFRPGEVVLLSFPFTDMAGAKKRPALVVADTGDDDIMAFLLNCPNCGEREVHEFRFSGGLQW